MSDHGEPPFEGAIYLEGHGWTTPGLAARLRRRKRKKPRAQLADETTERGLELSDDNGGGGKLTWADIARPPEKKSGPDPLSRAGREEGVRRRELEQVAREEERAADELRGREFCEAKSALRRDLLYGRVSQESADRQLAALEAKHPKADA